MIKKHFCIKCKCQMYISPEVGPYCPNDNCDNLDGPSIEIETMRGVKCIK